MPRLRRDHSPAPVRIGLCCGCHAPDDQVLFHIESMGWRYRCALCYRRETGVDAPEVRVRGSLIEIMVPIK